jgi:hypothetical protein
MTIEKLEQNAKGVVFLKTKFYPVNPNTKEIINLPFSKERDLFLMYRRSGFIGIRGARLNEKRCYQEFTIRGSAGDDNQSTPPDGAGSRNVPQSGI